MLLLDHLNYAVQRRDASTEASYVFQRRLESDADTRSWAIFAPGMKNTVLVIGYMVLFEDEVNPAMSVALDEGSGGNRPP
jgi:hypothetical protein